MVLSMKKIKTHDKIVELVLDSLKKEIIPWEKGWYGDPLCYNPMTGTCYRGVNYFMLRMISDIEKYEDPRWMTFNQIKKANFHLENAKGKGVPIVFWAAFNKEDKTEIKNSWAAARMAKEDPESIYFVARTYTVFNASLVKGIEPYSHRESVNDDQISLFLKDYIRSEGITLLHGGDEAYYQYGEDAIRLPHPDAFTDRGYYLDTLAHEISHSTGHQKRLDRRDQMIRYHFDDLERAKEELRAELGSMFINSELGIPPSEERIERHQAYIQSWISLIEEKPYELIQAIRDAEKIQSYVYEHGHVDLYIDRPEPKLLSEKSEKTNEREGELEK